MTNINELLAQNKNCIIEAGMNEISQKLLAEEELEKQKEAIKSRGKHEKTRRQSGRIE
jgi:hypothetical protein